MGTRYVNTLFFLLTFNKVVNLPFLYPLKMSENLCWSLVLIKLQAFRYRNGTLPLNGLIHKSAISLKFVFLQYFFREYLSNYAQGKSSADMFYLKYLFNLTTACSKFTEPQ